MWDDAESVRDLALLLEVIEIIMVHLAQTNPCEGKLWMLITKQKCTYVSLCENQRFSARVERNVHMMGTVL